MTFSAPSARATFTGTGLTSAPSISQRPAPANRFEYCRAAHKRRTLHRSAVRFSAQISCPVPTSVATEAKRIGRSSDIDAAERFGEARAQPVAADQAAAAERNVISIQKRGAW